MGETDFSNIGTYLNAGYVHNAGKNEKAPVFIEIPSNVAPDFPISLAESEFTGKKSITFGYVDKKNGMEKKIDAVLSNEEYNALKGMYDFIANVGNLGKGTDWNDVRRKNIELTEKASNAVAAVLDRNPKILDILGNNNTFLQAARGKEKERA